MWMLITILYLIHNLLICVLQELKFLLPEQFVKITMVSNVSNCQNESTY